MNFKFINEQDFKIINYKKVNPQLYFDEIITSDYLFELPVEYGGSLSNVELSVSNNMMAFDIKTGL